MMQDVDGVSRHTDPLVYRYTITTSSLYAEDVTERLFAYSFDVFYRCNNPRNVTASDALSISITISINPSISLLFFFIRPILPIDHQATDWYTLPVPGAPSPPIT